MEMKYINICIFFVIKFWICSCSICNDETFKYQIGESFSILDIRGDDISALPAECYKQINIPENIEAELSVESAQFSGDIYWSYSSALGMSKKVFHDDVLIYFGKCPPTASPSVSVRPGLEKTFNSSQLCLQFNPDVDFRNLGGHIAGGSIKINVNVKKAQCNLLKSTSQLTSHVSDCIEVCSKTGIIKRCPKVSENGHSSPQMTPTMQNFAPSAFTKTAVKKTQHTTATTETLSFPVTTTKWTSKRIHSTKIPETAHTVAVSSKKYSQGLSPSTQHTKYVTSNLLNKHTVPHSSTSSYGISTLARLVEAYKSQTDVKFSSTTSSAMLYLVQTSPDTQSDVAVFGLVEGLYVFGGCLLLIITLATVACCMASRKKKCFRPNSDSIASSDSCYSKNVPQCKDLIWRDNWLVQYHSNPAFTQSESDIDSLPVESIDQSDPSIDKLAESLSDNYDSFKIDEEDPYDNPWPRVRLDSSFVRKTNKREHSLGKELFESMEFEKGISNSLDSARSSSNITVNHYGYSAERDALDIIPIGEDLTKGGAKCNTETNTTCEEKTRTLRYKKNNTASTAKGSVNIRRVIKRSGSKSKRSLTPSEDVAISNGHRDSFIIQQKNMFEQCCMSMDSANVNLSGELDLSRKRSSSVCSDHSANLGAKTQQEVYTLEAGLSTDADNNQVSSNITTSIPPLAALMKVPEDTTVSNVPGDTTVGNVSGDNCRECGMVGELKVNTLYTLVSQRVGSTQSCDKN